MLVQTHTPLPRQVSSPVEVDHLGEVGEALTRLDTWIEREGFRGWDPHDALNSPVLRLLSFGTRLGGIFWLQALKRSPINIRPLLGIKKDFNPKGIGLFLASYLRKYAISGNDQDIQHVKFFAHWLADKISPGYHNACWGYNFDWPNRAFFAPAGTPTIVNTAFIGLAFVDANALLSTTARGALLYGSPWHASGPLGIARSACEFVLRELNSSSHGGETWFSYTPLDCRVVHNASMLGAELLAAVYRETREQELYGAALGAARFTARRQRPDGSWSYGEKNNDNWIDSFHTGFVLLSLKRIGAALETAEFDEALQHGYTFWRERMFEQDGRPKYYPERTYPIDVHSAAQAILTFLAFADRDSTAPSWALKVAYWAVRNMQDPAGYFHYQIHRRYRIRIPYIRWGQAWMQRALTEMIYQWRA